MSDRHQRSGPMDDNTNPPAQPDRPTTPLLTRLQAILLHFSNHGIPFLSREDIEQLLTPGYTDLTQLSNHLNLLYEHWDEYQDLSLISSHLTEEMLDQLQYEITQVLLPEDEPEEQGYSDYHASASGSSESDDDDIPENLVCSICDRRQVTVRFHCCVHAACTDCVKGIWRGRKNYREHFPDWFPCHMCREEVKEFDILDVDGKLTFWIKVPVMWWIRSVSRRLYMDEPEQDP